MKTLYLFLILIFSFTVTIAGTRIDDIIIIATEPNLNGGGYNQARVYIDQVSTNTSITITKPLIVFEGYDPGIYTKPKSKEGRTGIQDFIDEVIFDAPGSVSSELESLLHGTSQAYDIIYVNWVNGTDYLENNEKVAKTVINWVNQKKAEASSTQPNVIIGRSMGAVIARMALKHMENEYIANDPYHPRHDTRLFISNDGGMQGSNIPQGYQHLGNHFRDLYISTGAIGFTIETWPGITNLVSSPLAKLSVNETPASRQLQINHVNTSDDIDNTLHESFLASLNTLGYPTGDNNVPFKMIAASNGSECAKPQDIGSGGTILQYDGEISTTGLTSLLINIGFGLSAGLTGGAAFQAFSFPPLMVMGTVPGPDQFNLELKVTGKADNQANQVYKGKISYVKKVLGFIPVAVLVTNRSKTANASTLAYDYFPGGNQDLAREDLPLPKPGSDVWIEKNVTFTHQPYCHVPVPSALDIGQGNVTLTYADYFTPYHGVAPPPAPKSTAFTQGFLTAAQLAGVDNEPHTQIEKRNGDWMAAQIKNTALPLPGCEVLCNGPFVFGDAIMCNNTQLTLKLPLPQGASATWNAPSWVTVTPQNTQGSEVLVTSGSSSGLANLGVSIDYGTSGCGSGTILLSQLVKVGAPNYYTLTAPYTTEGYSDYLRQDGEGTNCLKTYTFPGMYSGDIDLSDPVAETYTWTFVSKDPSTATVSIGPLSTPQHVTVTVKPQYASVTYQLTRTNSCGSYSANYTFRADGYCAGTVERPSNISSISVSPNPVSGKCSVILTPGNSDASIRQIQILDKFGVTLKQYKYKAGELTQTVGMESLKPDIYVLQVFDGTTWISAKVAKE